MSEPIFNIHDAILLATAFQSFLFVLLILVAKSERHISDYFLMGFFLAQVLIPLHILINFAPELRAILLESSPNLFRAFDFAFWLEGPMLLWYTRALLFRDFSLRRIDAIYVLPVLLYLAYLMLTFFSWDHAAKVEYLINYHEILAPSLSHVLELAREALFVFFGVLCLLEIRHAQQQIHDRYSNIEKIHISWLGFLVIAFVVLRSWVLVVVLMAFVVPGLGVEKFNILGLIGNYLMFATISALIFFSLTRSAIFAGKISRSEKTTEPEGVQRNPELAGRIERHMLENKPYLSHLLNLEQLAKQLALHPRTLSIAIKQNFDTNFYEFVNSYRVNEAKRLLSDPAHSDKTMIEILGESGFNSKATFNAFFKKLVSKTPTQYRAEELASD